jgi:hypothetical protein
MSNGRDFSRIIEAARIHYQNLKTDIENSKDRLEYIRLTSLAQEAHNLLTDLRSFELGLVYTHATPTEEDFEKIQRNLEADAATTGDTFNEPLDLPEFRSPYDPRNL